MNKYSILLSSNLYSPSSSSISPHFILPQISCGISQLDERRRPPRLHHRLGGPRHRCCGDDHRVPDQQVEAEGRHQERRSERGVTNMHTVTDIFLNIL